MKTNWNRVGIWVATWATVAGIWTASAQTATSANSDSKTEKKEASAASTASSKTAKKFLLPDNADEAWKLVQKSLRPPPPPAEWNQRAPEPSEQQAYRKTVAQSAGQAADKAREFRERFPTHPRAGDAKESERKALAAAVDLGDSERKEALEKAGGAPEAPTPAPQDEFEMKVMAVLENAKKEANGDFKKLASTLIPKLKTLKTEFPTRPELDSLLLECAGLLGGGYDVLALIKEIEESKTDPRLKAQAAQLRRKLEAIGKPLSMEFTAVDGRKVDLLQMQGKVVLIDFWATWCGPCIQELPNVKKAYEALKGQGFEIVGISFDQDERKLKDFVRKQEMPWVQYFDGKGWQNRFGQEFGINSIPAMWLVDKKGNLRDTDARDGLEKKVRDLLAEK